MRYFIIMIALIFFLCSCSHIWIRFDPETKTYDLGYWRLGNQELHGLKIEKGPEGTQINLDSQKATDESLQEILKIVRQLAIALP